jgi:hypothetical protein
MPANFPQFLFFASLSGLPSTPDVWRDWEALMLGACGITQIVARFSTVEVAMLVGYLALHSDVSN